MVDRVARPLMGFWAPAFIGLALVAAAIDLFLDSRMLGRVAIVFLLLGLAFVRSWMRLLGRLGITSLHIQS